jgi:hypothetical protein
VFSRDRKLTINNLVFMILTFKSAIQRDLDRFFKELTDSDFNIRQVTKGAFSKARSKLSPWAFKRLNEVAVNTFYQDAPYHKWHNKRLLAVDGTRLMLPNHSTTKAIFGVHKFGPKADSERSLAVASVLYDVLNLIGIDSQIDSYDSSEKDLLELHMEHLKENDLLLLDRGYPSICLLFLLTAKKVDFCIRMKEKWWIKVKEFSETKDQERIVTFKLPKKDWKKLEKFPELRETEIKCRLVKIILENGEKEILCTSLLDNNEYKHEEFKDLYHCRWSEEEAYKLLKSRMELEKFSGKTALAVQQDFHSKILLMTLAAAFAHPIEEKVRAEYKADQNRKHDQKINRTNTLANIRDIIVSVFLKGKIKKALEAYDDIVYKTREIITQLAEINHQNQQIL